MEDSRSAGQCLVHGSSCAFLAAVTAIMIQFWWIGNIHWWVVGVCAIFGFLLGWFVGGEAFDFLKSLPFWW